MQSLAEPKPAYPVGKRLPGMGRSGNRGKGKYVGVPGLHGQVEVLLVHLPAPQNNQSVHHDDTFETKSKKIVQEPCYNLVTPERFKTKFS